MLLETFVRSLRLKVYFEKRRNIANVFLGLILIACAPPIWANVFSTSKMKDYIEYEDQEYAENKYLEIGPMCNYTKILYKTVPVNDSSVCNLTRPDVFKVCEEIVHYLIARNSFKNRYAIHKSSRTKECSEYALKLNWDYGGDYGDEMEKKNETVMARKCPTLPSLYISDGKNIGGIFVYVARAKGKKELKLIDYITFKERTTPVTAPPPPETPEQNP